MPRVRPGGKAEQQVRVLTHDIVRHQLHALARGGQRVEGAHRHVNLVADAADVNDDCGGCLATSWPVRRPIMIFLCQSYQLERQMASAKGSTR
jgi:hypothetical protein